jgi:hypothetical protein
MANASVYIGSSRKRQICERLDIDPEDLDVLTADQLRELSKASDAELDAVRSQIQDIVNAEPDDADTAKAAGPQSKPASFDKQFTQALSQEVTQQQLAPALGWGPDGIYRCTDAQLRDPIWCFATQADRKKAGVNLEIIP